MELWPRTMYIVKNKSKTRRIRQGTTSVVALSRSYRWIWERVWRMATTVLLPFCKKMPNEWSKWVCSLRKSRREVIGTWSPRSSEGRRCNQTARRTTSSHSSLMRQVKMSKKRKNKTSLSQNQTLLKLLRMFTLRQRIVLSRITSRLVIAGRSSLKAR